jgi:hypothetical protein
MWIVVTLVLGILLLIRGIFIIFFLENIKKILPNIYKTLLQIFYPYFNDYGLFSLFNRLY